MQKQQLPDHHLLYPPVLYTGWKIDKKKILVSSVSIWNVDLKVLLCLAKVPWNTAVAAPRHVPAFLGTVHSDKALSDMMTFCSLSFSSQTTFLFWCILFIFTFKVFIPWITLAFCLVFKPCSRESIFNSTQKWPDNITPSKPEKQ